MEDWKSARNYHERTKHHFHQFARGPGYLDWGTQPDPFRRFDRSPLNPLPLGAVELEAPYDNLYEPGSIPVQAFNLNSIGSFFELSLAISAWKQFNESKWALRVNPSSGNLHPTEGYLIAPPVDGLSHQPGVYHYTPLEHGLERRCSFSIETWNQLTGPFPSGTFFIALTSIHWREAWKYGERAYRYCQHDAGHALAALAISAKLHGWGAVMLDAMSDDEISRLLGLNRDDDFDGTEREDPDLVVAIFPPDARATVARAIPAKALGKLALAEWLGKANMLSPDHVAWDLIDETAVICHKPHTEPFSQVVGAATHNQSPGTPRPDISAKKIIIQRRSAVAFDGETSVTAGRFYGMMSRVMPEYTRTPWNTFGPPAAVDLGLFVHRVDGIPPGFYCLLRNPDEKNQVRASMSGGFQWKKPAGSPDGLPLYFLLEGDCRKWAAQVSCGQEIAGDSAFSLGMIACFEPLLQKHGAWFYRRLFWETGVIGQILYLEAEAAGIRATGIGCFFDDPVHEAFGIKGMEHQSLYHFTVGGPVDDSRLTTLPPYPSYRYKKT